MLKRQACSLAIGFLTVIGATASTAIYSPYKDTSISLNWNTNVISTVVNGQSQPVPILGDDNTPSQLQPGNHALTLAFATGQCMSESWGGIAGNTLAGNNLAVFDKNNMGYIISTGGAAGIFTCDNADNMQKFLQRYGMGTSPNFKGIDFDIEGGYNQAQLQQLMSATSAVQKQQPSLRVSLTLATLAQSGSTLNQLGQWAVDAANQAGLQYNVNLMVMDYGSSGCQQSAQGQCDMAKSAEYAAKEVSRMYNIPLSRIELTPMIGDNDTQDEVTTLADIKAITQFVQANHLAGLHFWSFDRDRACRKVEHGSLKASPTCNTQSDQPEAFNKAVLANWS